MTPALDAWQRPEIARHVVRDLPGGQSEAMLLIEGVRCTACVWLIERALLGALPASSTRRSTRRHVARG